MSDGLISVDEQLIAEVKANGANITAFGFTERGMKQMRLVDPDATYISNPQQIVDIFSGIDVRYIAEPLLEGVTVYLDQNHNGYLDPNEPLSVSRMDDPNTLSVDETGQYEFTGLAPGNYSVGIVVAPQREQTFPINSNRLSVSVEAGGDEFQ